MLELLDTQVTRELGVVAAHLLDEPLGVLATNVSIASPSGWSRLEGRSTIAYEHHHTSAGEQLLKDLLVAVMKLEMAGVCPYPEINAIHSLQ
jgi:hypothetical protein